MSFRPDLQYEASNSIREVDCPIAAVTFWHSEDTLPGRLVFTVHRLLNVEQDH